jgi:hypothetical protein
MYSRVFVAVFTGVHLDSWIQPIPSRCIFLRSMLMFSSHVHLGLFCGLSTKILYAYLVSCMCATFINFRSQEQAHNVTTLAGDYGTINFSFASVTYCTEMMTRKPEASRIKDFSQECRYFAEIISVSSMRPVWSSVMYDRYWFLCHYTSCNLWLG